MQGVGCRVYGLDLEGLFHLRHLSLKVGLAGSQTHLDELVLGVQILGLGFRV